MNPSLRDKILRSPFLPIIVFPFRLKLVFRHLTYQGRLGAMWLFRSKEFANFTYDLTPANKDYLAWFVSGVCNVPVQQIKKYFLELESNVDLKEHIATRLRANRRGKEIDGQAFFGRRLGWYAIVRATKPNVIVETGTEKGLGSLVLAEALLRNNRGRLVTIDIEPQSGLLIGGKWARVVEQVIEDSLVALNNIDNIDLFIHDSDHSADHEFRELESVVSHLSADGTVLSDNSHVTSMLADWSLKHNRLFLFFAEKPLNHWYPGAGIGVSVKRPTISQISKKRP